MLVHDTEHIDRHRIVFSFLELQIIDEGVEFTHQDGVQSGSTVSSNASADTADGREARNKAPLRAGFRDRVFWRNAADSFFLSSVLREVL